MATGFVLIRTSPGHERDVYYSLHEMPGIREVHPLVGHYDLIVRIEAENHDKLGYIVLDQINHIQYVHDTETLTVAQF